MFRALCFQLKIVCLSNLVLMLSSKYVESIDVLRSVANKDYYDHRILKCLVDIWSDIKSYAEYTVLVGI